MNIAMNHVTLLMLASRKGGLKLNQALEIDQRTLGSACSKTTTRDRLIDYSADLDAFTITPAGRWVLDHEIPRKAVSRDQFSRGVARIAKRRGLQRIA